MANRKLKNPPSHTHILFDLFSSVAFAVEHHRDRNLWAQRFKIFRGEEFVPRSQRADFFFVNEDAAVENRAVYYHYILPVRRNAELARDRKVKLRQAAYNAATDIPEKLLRTVSMWRRAAGQS